MSFTHNDKDFTILNMYAPAINNERAAFLRDLPDLSTFFLQHTHVNGDFIMLTSYTENINGLPHSQREINAFNVVVHNFIISYSKYVKRIMYDIYSLILIYLPSLNPSNDNAMDSE